MTMEQPSTSSATLARLNPNSIKSLLQDTFERRTLAEKLLVKQLGPDQPPGLSIKQQTGVQGKPHMRSFCKDWYTRKAWLAGCSQANAVFCFPCVLFKSTGSDSAWAETGVRDMKHLSEKIRKHENTRMHIDNSVKLAMLGRVNIAMQLDEGHRIAVKKHNEEVDKNWPYPKKNPPAATAVRHKAAVKEEQLMPVISHYCSLSVSEASTPTDLQTAFGATPTLEEEPSPVVQLNVGGHLFSTSLSTIRKHPESRLAELFSRPPKLRTDAQGRYFIDRDGSHFGAVLEFLRSDLLPTENIQEVHGEAVYYNIKPLIKRLEETPQLFGELVGRQQFLSRVPHYKENIEVLIRIARAEAIAARHSTIMICILRTEEELGFYENAINSLEADKESVVTFGPWKAVLSVKDLLDCVKMDIESQGYKVSIQPHVVEKNFLSRSYDYFHKLIFTWW